MGHFSITASLAVSPCAGTEFDMSTVVSCISDITVDPFVIDITSSPDIDIPSNDITDHDQERNLKNI